MNRQLIRRAFEKLAMDPHTLLTAGLTIAGGSIAIPAIIGHLRAIAKLKKDFKKGMGIILKDFVTELPGAFKGIKRTRLNSMAQYSEPVNIPLSARARIETKVNEMLSNRFTYDELGRLRQMAKK